jgi:DNA-binding MarR family transcriptional regulator
MYLGEVTDPELTALASDLAIQASRVVRLIRQNSQQVAGIRTLSVLDEHGPLSVTALAEIDNCSQPTMTATVRQLLEAGWVGREPHPTDARSRLIALTDDGRAELARVRAANADLIATRITHHTPEQLATAVAVLRDVLTPSDEPEETRP